MEILFVALILGLIPALIARKKGRNFFGWYIYGTLIFIVALVHSLVAKENTTVLEEEALKSGTMKKCEFCAEIIKVEAKVCKFCNKDVE